MYAIWFTIPKPSLTMDDGTPPFLGIVSNVNVEVPSLQARPKLFVSHHFHVFANVVLQVAVFASSNDATSISFAICGVTLVTLYMGTREAPLERDEASGSSEFHWLIRPTS